MAALHVTWVDQLVFETNPQQLRLGRIEAGTIWDNGGRHWGQIDYVPLRTDSSQYHHFTMPGFPPRIAGTCSHHGSSCPRISGRHQTRPCSGSNVRIVLIKYLGIEVVWCLWHYKALLRPYLLRVSMIVL